MRDRILFVDDDPDILMFYEDYLGRQFSIDTALSGPQALELIAKRGPYAVLVADMNMPDMNGVELLMSAKQIAPDTVRMVLTADADQSTAVEAINKGHIFWFLTKPCPPEVLISGLLSAIKQHRLATAERELLENTLSGSIKMLTEILSTVEPQSFGLGQRIRDYVRVLANYLGLNQSWDLEVAAMLCRIGYITIPISVLQKLHGRFPLNPMERNMVMRVPEFGSKLLEHISRLGPVAEIICYQNKNFDGTSFPYDDIAGEKIPYGARVLRILIDLAQHEKEGLARAKAIEIMQS